MQTPTISKKSAKKTLSARKTKKKTIKNVLAAPSKSSWPALSPEDETTLTDTLNKYLPLIKGPKFKIPYKDIKDIPKGDRQSFRERMLNQSDTPQVVISQTDRKSLIFGVNTVSQSIITRECLAVLIAGKVTPRLLVQHLIDEAASTSTPLLVCGDLRNILTQKCGLSGCSVALAKSIEKDSGLWAVYECIRELWEKRGNHIQPEAPQIQCDESEVIVCEDSVIETVVVKPPLCHLKRTSRERSFQPPAIEEEVAQCPSTSTSSSSFWAFDNPVGTTNGVYKPLVVKRVKGDENRNERKRKKLIKVKC